MESDGLSKVQCRIFQVIFWYEPRKLYAVPREMGTVGELKDEIGLKSRVIRDAIGYQQNLKFNTQGRRVLSHSRMRALYVVTVGVKWITCS